MKRSLTRTPSVHLPRRCSTNCLRCMPRKAMELALELALEQEQEQEQELELAPLPTMQTSPLH